VGCGATDAPALELEKSGIATGLRIRFNNQLFAIVSKKKSKMLREGERNVLEGGGTGEGGEAA
jgi:hypothetical protein